MLTINISGFGGGYELACQKMLRNGIDWLELNPDKAEPVFKSYENVFGIAIAENTAAKELDAAMMKGIDDATGAMHHAVSSHLVFIAKNGMKSWLEEYPEESKFDFDGTEKSIPVRD